VASRLGTTPYGKEEEMSRSKKFLAILKDDKKLLGMFGGIVVDVAFLVAIVVTACVWYLP
jgi:hypothetical protein